MGSFHDLDLVFIPYTYDLSRAASMMHEERSSYGPLIFIGLL
jgi:hypothetical protein